MLRVLAVFCVAAFFGDGVFAIGAAAQDKPRPDLRVKGAIRFVSGDGYDTKVRLNVRCFAGANWRCQEGLADHAPAGLLHVKQKRANAEFEFSVAPYCVQVNSPGGEARVTRIEGPVITRGGPEVGNWMRLYIGDRSKATTSPDVANVAIVQFDPDPLPGFCPDPLRGSGATVSSGNVKIVVP